MTSKKYLITSQAVANDPEKLKVNVDNLLKAALKKKGEVRLEVMEDREAKDEEEKEEFIIINNYFTGY